MGLADVLAGMDAAEQQEAASLKRLVEKLLVDERVVPPPETKAAGKFVRASGLAALCPREEVLAGIHKITRSEKLNAASMLTFAHGTALHQILQDEVLPKVGVLRGEWACLSCGAHVGGMTQPNVFLAEQMVPYPTNCGYCNEAGGKFRYVEQYFRNTDYGITGHPDGYIELAGRDGLGVLEAKSISSKGAWEIRKVPKFDHVIQAQIYMWFTGLKWACLLYWDKGMYGIDCLTEHFIDRDESTLARIRSTLTSIWDGLDGGVVPDRICSNSTCERAKKCPCVSQCFASKE